MGKKSKRKSNNKLPSCYHGCITKKEFNFGGHHKILESYDKQSNTQEGRIEFHEKHQHIVSNPTFGRFVVAHVTDDYLKGKDNAMLLRRLLLLLKIRYESIPRQEGKDIGPGSKITKNYHKYGRDILTKRGQINCMAREIPCDCMEEKRIAAKSMVKVAWCYYCHNEVPKEQMLRCKGCDQVQYCSKNCSKKDWPRHKKYCRKGSSSATAPTSASAPTPTPASVPSSFTEPSDVGAED